ncbi:hypothetical protein GCM10010329_11490 [Streptomyces spiroverticillatus]|uniref:DUF397 domain-containing protein n=1 Tax=Streptomyces finlayi TaxID=67296 RepID=A0A919C9Z6_9ACTN|nr:DUF397 domain-containing protein [Streptomyces finlayi]GGZ92530.1 hypothetical protein GCM10010329_11490 [Streptomyces spiroverticillatus]GHC93031.1 hypothetical protein GCM10010334_29610 [Streptomyces finlayi]
MTEPQFFKSSYSSNGGNCIEIAANLAASHGVVPVRDSKNPGGPSLGLTTPAFSSFIIGIKSGAFQSR